MLLPSLVRPHPARQPRLTASEPDAAPGLLWLCCHLPLLPLEALGLAVNHPSAVVEDIKGRPHVLTPSTAALALGISPGLPLNAAYALCPQIRIESRRPELEQEAIGALAELCLKFTPWVNLDYPQALLLEVRGSLKLFGGLETLQIRLMDTVTRSGYTCRIATTPAPLASWLSASQGLKRTVMHPGELRSMLGELPITALGCGADVSARLAKAGLHSLRDLWRLPRDGLARRYGAGLLEILDRAAGHTADTPRLYHSPPRFGARLELPFETDNLPHYFPAVEHLVKRLTAFLSAHDAAVAELRLLLYHGPVAPSVIRLELRKASRDQVHLLELFREKLERSPLPGPVRAVGLYAENLQPYVPQMADLFGTRAGEEAGEWQRVIEMLQARLGRGAVRMLSAPPDHRPEHACALSDSFHSSSGSPGGLRPNAVELTTDAPVSVPPSTGEAPRMQGRLGEEPRTRLEEVGWGRLKKGGERTFDRPHPDGHDRPSLPVALRAASPCNPAFLPGCLPWGEGAINAGAEPTSTPLNLRPVWLLPNPRPAAPGLRFLPGTERIESGWWDGPGMRRDYRMAIDRWGAKLWVYREPSHPKRWYLHGLFG